LDGKSILRNVWPLGIQQHAFGAPDALKDTSILGGCLKAYIMVKLNEYYWR
jgi:hypothetical protein